MKIEVYSDGSGTTKNTPGGYGYVVVADGVKQLEGNGHMPFATNNDAELEAAIQGLASISLLIAVCPDPVTDVWLVSDSQIILNWANGRNEFRQEEKIDKYNLLRNLVLKYNVKTRWVHGHDGDEHNERCDKLANAARLKKEII